MRAVLNSKWVTLICTLLLPAGFVLLVWAIPKEGDYLVWAGLGEFFFVLATLVLLAARWAAFTRNGTAGKTVTIICTALVSGGLLISAIGSGYYNYTTGNPGEVPGVLAYILGVGTLLIARWVALIRDTFGLE